MLKLKFHQEPYLQMMNEITRGLGTLAKFFNLFILFHFLSTSIARFRKYICVVIFFEFFNFSSICPGESYSTTHVMKLMYKDKGVSRYRMFLFFSLYQYRLDNSITTIVFRKTTSFTLFMRKSNRI